jgi:hypothetical protein
MKNGLKGITDATVFCKSMQKGGPAPMIRSMKSYEVGGMTDTASGECYEMVQEGPGRPKRRKKKKCPGNRQSVRSYNRSRRVPGL